MAAMIVRISFLPNVAVLELGIAQAPFNARIVEATVSNAMSCGWGHTRRC
jgi:ABC-type methionine transport system permease subunit